MTFHPRLAMRAAVRRPIYPSPTTQTVEASLIMDHTRNAFTCATVPVRIGGPAHRLVVLPIIQQPLGLTDNVLRVCPHQSCRAGLDGLGAFGRIAQHQHGLSE